MRNKEACEGRCEAAFGPSNLPVPTKIQPCGLFAGTKRIFWLADEAPESGNFSPESLSPQFRGGCTVRMVMAVDDPDAVFRRAIEAGAKLIFPVEDQEYGWRVGRFSDPFGHHWEIGKPL